MFFLDKAHGLLGYRFVGPVFGEPLEYLDEAAVLAPALQLARLLSTLTVHARSLSFGHFLWTKHVLKEILKKGVVEIEVLTEFVSLLMVKITPYIQLLSR